MSADTFSFDDSLSDIVSMLDDLSSETIDEDTSDEVQGVLSSVYECLDQVESDNMYDNYFNNRVDEITDPLEQFTETDIDFEDEYSVSNAAELLDEASAAANSIYYAGEDEVLDYWKSISDDDDDEGISLYDARDIWKSSGEDEDQMFEYSIEELEDDD